MGYIEYMRGSDVVTHHLTGPGEVYIDFKILNQIPVARVHEINNGVVGKVIGTFFNVQSVWSGE